MRKISFLFILIACMAGAGTAHAQADRQHVRKGNQLFRKGDFEKAALEYRKALSVNEGNTQAIYNLGVASLQQ